MNFKTLLKALAVIYVILVVTAQSIFFLADRFIDNNLSRIESFSGNISNLLKDTERLAFLLALGMIENEEVLPMLEQDLNLRGLPQYAELARQMQNKSN